MTDQKLRDAIIDKLRSVIDPETGVDVIRMQLVREISIDDKKKVRYIFRPSSPLCPIAVPLALGIIEAISQVPGVSAQDITVVDYIQADQLNATLKSILEE